VNKQEFSASSWRINQGQSQPLSTTGDMLDNSKPSFYSHLFYAILPICNISSFYFLHFRFNALWLVHLYFFKSIILLLKHNFFICALLINANFSGTQLGHKTRAGCILIYTLQRPIN